MTQWVIIGAAVIVLVVGGAWLVMRDRATNTSASENSNATSTTVSSTPAVVEATNNVPKGTVTATSDGESVSVADQPAGTSVALSSMSLTHATWIAVRDDMSILGAAWFPSSATSGTVELQRGTQGGKSYRVVMYVDDGDKKFDMRADKLITAEAGPVGTSFDAQ